MFEGLVMRPSYLYHWAVSGQIHCGLGMFD